MDHLRRAKRGQHENHPFYSALRKYGTESITWSILFECEDLEEAKTAERNAIAILGTRDREHGYNLSEGGDYDCLLGPQIFWNRVRSDQEFRDAYYASLREAAQRRKQSGGFPRPDHLIEANRKILEQLTPREKWKRQWRRVRMARKTVAEGKYPSKTEPEWKKNSDTNSKRETLKNLRSVKSRIAAKKQWASRSPEKIAEVSRKIGEKVSKAYKNKSPDKLGTALKQLQSARSRIDRSVQGPAASKGIKQFWAELKSEPARYAEYMAKRNESLLSTLRGKGYAIKNDL